MAALLALALAAGLRAAPADVLLEKFEPKLIRCESGFSMRYRLYAPDGAAKASLPLLLLLHSISERGDDNLAPYAYFRPNLSPELLQKFPCAVAIPQCPRWKYWWEAKPAEALEALVPQLLKGHPEIDPRRIYVSGVSLGGYACYALLAANPKRWAAAVPICGDPSPTPLKAAMILDTPIWIFHGAKDSRVPVRGDRELVGELSGLGGHPRYREYPEEGHRIKDLAYAEPGLWDWLFAQKRAEGP